MGGDCMAFAVSLRLHVCLCVRATMVFFATPLGRGGFFSYHIVSGVAGSMCTRA